MRKKLVVGNWKLHGSLVKNEKLMLELAAELEGLANVDYGICLPYPYLFQAQQLLTNTSVLWGAQNVSQFISGAYTSSVSASMIADFGCAFAIVGHSERRSYSHESNQMAIVRVKRTVEAGIVPIYCVGETVTEHEKGQAKRVIKAQVLALLNLHQKTLMQAKSVGMVIAYEPVWAIGTGQAAKPEHAQAIHQFIRSLIARRDPSFAEKIRIIYGGSLSPENACSLFTMPDIDGGLVGRCALNASSFKAVCELAADTSQCTAI